MTHRRDDPIESLQREVERLFHDLVYRRHPATHFAESTWSPAADLVVSQQDARILFELAGVPHASVRVILRGRTLEVKGRRARPHEPSHAHYHRAEIYFGDFRREIELPWEPDPDRVEARYQDGMLEIQLVPAAVPAQTDVPIEEG